jgi:hypothetical protein
MSRKKHVESFTLPRSYAVESVLVNGELYPDYDYSEGRLYINNLELSLNDDWLILLNV